MVARNILIFLCRHKEIMSIYWEAKVNSDFGISDWPRTLMELILNPRAEFRWSSEGPVSQIHSCHLHVGDPGVFSVLLRSIQMLKRKWDAESNGKLPHLFIPSKTATLVPEFAVESLPSDRTTTLVLCLQWSACLPFGRTIWWSIYWNGELNNPCVKLVGFHK